MRRIQRLRKPSSATLTQHASTSIPETAPAMCGIAASTTTCLPCRARSFSTGRRMSAVQRTLTDLVLPPRETSEAKRADEINALKSTQYTPADSAEGLEAIGGLDGWFKNNKHWSFTRKVARFAPREKIYNSRMLQLTAARAVLEAVAVAQAGAKARDLLRRAWCDGGRADLNRVVGLSWELDADGNVIFRAGQQELVQRLKSVPENNVAAISAQETCELLEMLPQQWKDIALDKTDLKFAVSKRIYQLTGHLIPDNKLMPVRTAEDVRSLLVRPPAPSSVAHGIHQKAELGKLPNVRVFGERITPVHKAQQVGMWKIIKTELIRRDLPVLGRDRVDKIRENEWYRGPKPPPKAKGVKKRR